MGAIVGRDAESSAIEAFLDRSAAGPRALVIDGTAGIGKSTLWMGAVAAARARGFAVLAARPAETERLLANVVLGDLFHGVGPGELAALAAPRLHAFESALLMRDISLPVDSLALAPHSSSWLPRRRLRSACTNTI